PAGTLSTARIVTISVGLPAQEGRNIEMVVALWRCSNRRRTAMGVQSLRRWTARILRYGLVGRDLFGHGALGRLAFGQRRHRRTRRPSGDRRLALLVAAAEADIGEALQQRQ